MKLQTVWTKAVVVIYLVVVVGACLYVPSYYAPNRGKFDYRGVWVLNLVEYGQEDRGSWSTIGSTNGPYGTRIWIPNLHDTTNRYPLLIDYGRVALEVVSLTAVAGVLFFIGSFVEGRKRGKQSDPVNRE
ncbi:hypothetical protein [Candidatus Cryosericum septentrionale]|jgi:hypothetical protein|uniref:Uncharacterized protein n=1 Tax=Candidatus Cryosericum septentrionale TaxID=2290913 RepID=A0A398DMW7_9BACT|nr:hypothetical protein [Candidatus Cryosericum septentrionale]RIE16952.1 hypothetical protein SMC1_03870 [Candidatus Cryosericum septentrionale]